MAICTLAVASALPPSAILPAALSSAYASCSRCGKADTSTSRSTSWSRSSWVVRTADGEGGAQPIPDSDRGHLHRKRRTSASLHARSGAEFGGSRLYLSRPDAGAGTSSSSAGRARTRTPRRSFSLLSSSKNAPTATPGDTIATFSAPSRTSLSEPPAGEGQDSSPHDLAEELALPSATSKNGAGGTGSSDQINTLLRYPTLYDPIRKPRNPIVLCHGLYGFDSWGLEILPSLRIHYWADVLTVMKGVVGIDPIITGVPGTGSVEDRARKLHQALAKDLKKGQEINFVGHSMGGLDCRYLLSSIKPTEYNPLSLTTLATPHRGSPFMEWCRANIGIGDLAKAAVEASKQAVEGNSAGGAAASSLAESRLPYSLKQPLLTRKQREERAEAARKAGGADGEHAERERQARDDSVALSDAIGSSTSSSSASTSSSSSTSRESKQAAIQQVVFNLPGLNYSLSTTLASYLLDLLDSPAYSNLTPAFLNGQFNRNNPDVDHVRYFSVAARTPKLSVTHPLWLPKLICDKAEELEQASDKKEGRKRPEGWMWGNDGLVPVESSKWGEFLGVIDGADHWSLRGGSGLKQDFSLASAASSAKKLGTTASKQLDDVTDKAREMASSALPDSVGNVASAVMSAATGDDTASPGDAPEASGSSSSPSPSQFERRGTDRTAKVKEKEASGLSWSFLTPKREKQPVTSESNSSAKGKDIFSSISGVASWIAKKIPLSSTTDKHLRSSIDSTFPLEDALQAPPLATEQGGITAAAGAPSPSLFAASPSIRNVIVSSQSAKDRKDRSALDTARLLFGAGGSSAQASGKAAKDATKFSHERFYVALCKKLYDEGL